jgi:hypothetical protein
MSSPVFLPRLRQSSSLLRPPGSRAARRAADAPLCLSIADRHHRLPPPPSHAAVAAPLDPQCRSSSPSIGICIDRGARATPGEQRVARRGASSGSPVTRHCLLCRGFVGDSVVADGVLRRALQCRRPSGMAHLSRGKVVPVPAIRHDSTVTRPQTICAGG